MIAKPPPNDKDRHAVQLPLESLNAAAIVARDALASLKAQVPTKEGWKRITSQLQQVAATLRLGDPLRVANGRVDSQLRDYMRDLLQEAADLPPAAATDIQEWIDNDANLAGLGEFLESRNGWSACDKDSLEAAFVASARRWDRGLAERDLERRAAKEKNTLTAAMMASEHTKSALLDRICDANRPFLGRPFPNTGDGESNVVLEFPGLYRKDPNPTGRHQRRMDKWETEAGLPLEILKGLDVLTEFVRQRAWFLLGLFLNDEPGERWLRELAAAYLNERLERAKQTHNAKPLRARTILLAGHEWGRVPKLASGMSWAFGGQFATVELDGHTFSPAPGMQVQGKIQRARMPQGYALLPADHTSRPHQAALPMDMKETEQPLAVAVIGATQYALSSAAGRLGLYIMAAAQDGEPRRTTLRALTEAINPKSARLGKSHYKTASEGLIELANLRLFMPNGWSYAVFYLPTLPWKDLNPKEYDTPIAAGVDPVLARLLVSKEDPAMGPYRGWFLVDLTGAMGLKSGGLRQYVRTCGIWNAYWHPGGGPDPARIPPIPTDRWAAMTNSLPLAAVDYLRANKQQQRGRNRLSEAIKALLEDAEEMAALGLVTIDKANRSEIRLLPPQIYLEAWQDAKRGGNR